MEVYMKKLYAALCLASALFLSSCDAFLNPNNDKTPATSEYTKDNDVPAIQAPFDKNLCYQTADSLELSDGEWTIVMCQESPSVFNEKSISYATVKNNKETINSGILKIDIPFDSEEDSIDELPASEADFEAVFNEIQAMWVSAGYEEGKNYTFKKGYLTKDNTIVLILDATEINKKTFNLQKLTGTIKTNPNKTKYVITVTHEQSGTSLPVYIYKNANLNDKESIPENLPEDKPQNDNQDDLTDIVKKLDYSECKNALNLSELLFADGDWEIVFDQTLSFFMKSGTLRLKLNASYNKNSLTLKDGKEYVFFTVDSYDIYTDKKTAFKQDLIYHEFEESDIKSIMMDDNYLVADFGDRTTSDLADVKYFLGSSNLSAKSNLKILTNDSKSKYKLTFNDANYSYTVYFNKVGGAEAEEPSVTPGEEEPEPESQEPSVTPEPSEPSEEQEPSVTPETPKPSEDQNEAGDENEEEENPLTKLYNSENDVPASKVPFDKDLCTKTVNSLSLTNGNWKIVDIALGKDRQLNYDFTTITDVTYSDGQYECTSSVSKFDFQRNEANESFDYKAAFDTFALNPLLKTFSHGYSTASTHVVIAKNDVQLFTQVYLAQLNTVPALSNKTGTKYVIPFTKNGYLQTIYIYKVNAEEEPAEDLGYTVPELPANVGTDHFKGKTFGETTEKYVFGNDNTITVYRNLNTQSSEEPDVRAQFKYQYTYDANTKLLTYRCVMMLDPTTVKLATFNEIKANLSKLTSGAQNPEELYDYYVSSVTELFETPKVWKAELSDGKLSVYDPYYTEVPDLTKTNLQLRQSFNNTSVEILVTQYDKSTITIVIPVDYTDDKGVLHSNSSSIKTEYEITSLTENTITAIEKEKMERNNVENGEYYSVVSPNPATITIEYKNTKAKDGLIYIDISGKDDITKQALGADEETPDPSYTVISTNDHPHTYPLMN